MNTQTIKRIYDVFAKKAVEIFNADGSASPQLFVIFEPDSDKPQFFGFPPEFSNELLCTESGKDSFKSFLARVLKDEGFHEHLLKSGFPKPALVVQISEVWVSNLTGIDPRKRLPPSKDPMRTEAIAVAIHTSECTLMGMCPIVDSPTRHAEYRDLDLETRNVGRLSLTTEATLQ